MEEGKKKNIIIAILTVIIVILAVLCVLFATGAISFKSDKENDNSVNQVDSINTNEYTIKSMTSAKFDMFWDGTERELSVVDGKLVVEGSSFSVENEHIKYFYFNRYQCSRSTVIYYLTEEGNVYVTEMSANDNNLKLESLHNFKKQNYTNVTDIVVIPNDNYGKAIDDVSGMIDNITEYLYALVDGETFKLDFQYRC